MSQSEKMEEIFFPSHDMTDYGAVIGSGESYLENKTLVKLLGEQDSSGDVSSYRRRWARAIIQECL